MKSMGVYEVTALLISVFWFVGCSRSMQGPVSSSNPPVVSMASRASSKLLNVIDSIESTAQGFAIDSILRIRHLEIEAWVLRVEFELVLKMSGGMRS